jgi:hypothetical protein
VPIAPRSAPVLSSASRLLVYMVTSAPVCQRFRAPVFAVMAFARYSLRARSSRARSRPAPTACGYHTHRSCVPYCGRCCLSRSCPRLA